MSRGLPYFIVDAFTSRLFSGNPAAVVMLDSWSETAWLQNLAMEMNLSETAFLVRNESGYDLRWFTPKVEVDLCGHATIASAVVLTELGCLANETSIDFCTRSGVLTARRQGKRFLLDFPALPVQQWEPPRGLLESLNVIASYVGRSKFDLLVVLDSDCQVRDLRPDFQRLRFVDCRGVAVTARSEDPQFDFVSRFFAPAAGVDEDPVTGSAHCLLGPYWSAALRKSHLIGYQASRRGGVVEVKVDGPRTILGGEGVIFAKGQIEGSKQKAQPAEQLTQR